MAIDFPNSPTVGQVFIVGNVAWSWDGTKWVASTIATPLPVASGGTGANNPSAALANLGGAPIASPTFTGTVNAAALSTSGAVNLNGTPNNIKGVTDGSNAAAGQVGEVLSGSSAPASITSGVIGNAVALTLTAGDWDVSGTVGYQGAGGAVVSYHTISISTVSNTHGTPGVGQFFSNSPTNQNANFVVPVTRVSISASTSVFGVATVGFSPGTLQVNGTLFARRVR